MRLRGKIDYGVDVLGQVAEEERTETEGFTEALDPNRELGDLPSEETPAEGEEAAEG